MLNDGATTIWSFEDMFFSKDIETFTSSYGIPEDWDKLALNIFNKLQAIKEPVGKMDTIGEFKTFFNKYSDQEEFIQFIRKKSFGFLKELSKLCDFLLSISNKFSPKKESTSSNPKPIEEDLSKISNELFKLTFQYYEACDTVFKKTDWMKSFEFVDVLEKDQASILGISIATGAGYPSACQVIPSCALALKSSQTGVSLSLHSIDPEIGCPSETSTRAAVLGVTLKEGYGPQKATTLDESVKINLHKASFPLGTYAVTPVSEAFFQKFKKILSDKLKRGDTVIFGNHHAGTNIDPMLARLFNELKTEQPRSQLILHVQGGLSQSIYYQAPFDFESHHRYFNSCKGATHLYNRAVYLSCIVAQFPVLKQQTEPSSKLSFE